MRLGAHSTGTRISASRLFYCLHIAVTVVFVLSELLKASYPALIRLDETKLKYVVVFAVCALEALFWATYTHTRPRARDEFARCARAVLLSIFALAAITVFFQLQNGYLPYAVSEILFMLVPIAYARVFLRVYAGDVFKVLAAMFRVLLIANLIVIAPKFTPQNIRAIDFRNSYSPFESEFSFFWTVLFILFLFLRRPKYYVPCLIMNLLGFKRLGVVVCFFLLAAAQYLSPGKRVSARLVRATAWFFVFVPLMYVALVSSPAFARWFLNAFDMSLYDFTMSRSYLIERCLREGMRYGLGSTYTYLNYNLHSDLTRIYLECTIIGSVAFTFAYFRFAMRNIACYVLVSYIFLEMLVNHMCGAGRALYWIMAYLSFHTLSALMDPALPATRPCAFTDAPENAARKTVGVVTYHASFSYGACLQALATQLLLEDMGFAPVIIDFIGENERAKKRFGYAPKRGLLSKARALFKDVCLDRYRLQKRAFDSFRRHYILTDQSYARSKDMNGLSFDVLAVGSDQVWNARISGGLERAFLLDFGQADKRISLSSSMGSYRPRGAEEADFTRLIRRFSAVSAREADAAAWIRLKTGIDAFTLLDPTLFLDAAAWRRALSLPEKGAGESGYLLTFFLSAPFSRFRGTVSAYAQQTRLPVWNIQLTNMLWPGVRKRVRGATPEEFARLIANARFVLTDSYHAVILSILFHRPFAALTNAGNPGRVEQLLAFLSLTDRMNARPDTASAPIDYAYADEILFRARAKGRAWIRRAIVGEEADAG